MDSSDMCNELAFNIGSGTSTVTRSWRIKVRTQILFKATPVTLLLCFRFPNMIATMKTWLLMVAPNISLVKQLT